MSALIGDGFPILVYMTVNKEFLLIKEPKDIPYLGTMKLISKNSNENELTIARLVDEGAHK